jgi:protein-L-isoaspartate(D-aspartate) O-methyltransferase
MTSIDFAKARENMIKQQLRTWEVLDERVLALVDSIPREHFLPEALKPLAYADSEIPIGHDEVMLLPSIEARIIQALNLQPTETVLEVGTGSGYLTALLARQASHVVSVDIHEDFSAQAGERLAALDITNVTLETGDASEGWDKHAPYDVIVMTGSLPALPESTQYALNVGGRLFAIVGNAPAMEAVLITRVGENEWTHELLFETDIPPVQHKQEPSRFVL